MAYQSYGVICRNCKPTGCSGSISPDNPIEIPCPACDEAGCELCQDGAFALTACPGTVFGLEFVQLARLYDRMKQGVPPVVGGGLDQSAWFMAFGEFLDCERSRIESELSKR